MPLDLLAPPTSAPVDLLAPRSSAPTPPPISTPKVGTAPVPAPTTPIAAPVSPPLAAPSVDLLAPKPPPPLTPSLPHGFELGSGPANLAPFAAQNVQAQRNDATGFAAEANLGGYAPQVNNLAGVPEQLNAADTYAPRSIAERRSDWLRKFAENPMRQDLGPVPQEQAYFRVNKEHFENAVHADNAGAHTEIGQLYQQGHSFYRLADGHYAVRKDLYDAIGPEKPTPEPPQSFTQDLKNVPANVGAGIQKGFGGVMGAVGTAIQFPRDTTRLDLSYPQIGPDGKLHTVEPTILGARSGAKTGFETSTGQALQSGSDYLIGGANLTEKELPVQNPILRQAVGVGELGVDAAMGALAGPAGFTASFAARSAGTMYANSVAQGDTRERAMDKAITAGMVAAITPKLMHIMPPEVGEDVATQVAKSYLGTGSMITAQSTLDQLTLKYGTGERINIGEIFPEAAAQGVVGVAFHGAGVAMKKAREGPAQPSPRTAEPPLTRPDTSQFPRLPTNEEWHLAENERKTRPAPEDFTKPTPPTATEAPLKETGQGLSKQLESSNAPEHEVEIPDGTAYEFQNRGLYGSEKRSPDDFDFAVSVLEDRLAKGKLHTPRQVTDALYSGDWGGLASNTFSGLHAALVADPEGAVKQLRSKADASIKPAKPDLLSPVDRKSSAQSGVTTESGDENKSPPERTPHAPPVEATAPPAAANAPRAPEAVDRTLEKPAEGGEGGVKTPQHFPDLTREQVLASHALGGPAKTELVPYADRAKLDEQFPDLAAPKNEGAAKLDAMTLQQRIAYRYTPEYRQEADAHYRKQSEHAERMRQEAIGSTVYDKESGEAVKIVNYRPDGVSGVGPVIQYADGRTRSLGSVEAFQQFTPKPPKAPAPNSGAPPAPSATGIAKPANVQQEAGQRGENAPEAPTGAEQAPAAPILKPSSNGKVKIREAPSNTPEITGADEPLDLEHPPLEELKAKRDAAIKAVFAAGLTQDMDRPKVYGKYPPEKRAILMAYDKAKGDYRRAFDADSDARRGASPINPAEPAKAASEQKPDQLSIEPHGTGLRIVRAGPEMTALGENWEGKKLGTYNKKAGGWIFHPKNEGEIKPVVDKINAERGAGAEAGKASDETPKTTFAPTAAEGAARPQVPRGKRGGFIALPDFKGLLGSARHVRERYSAIEAQDSAELASGLTQHVQAGHTAETIIRNFERKAFEGAPDKDKAIEEFRAIGWNNRATLAKAKGLPATGIPTLTAAEEAAIRAKPYIRKAIDLWNDEIAPAIQNIRTRSRLPMDPNAGNVDLFLNLPSEGSAAGGGESGVNLTPAFAKPMTGEGDYKLDPHDTLVSIVRGHLATDTSRDIAAAIRNRVSINPANVVDPLAKRNPLTFQQPKSGSYFQAQYKGRKTDVAAVDLNTNPMKAPELHYVPKRVAEAMDQARQSTDPHDTPIDKLMHGATRLGLIGDFAPHALRVLFQVASRVGQSGQSAASAVPWIGSIPATIVRMAKMAKSPLAETMQLLIDKGGASRGSGYNLAEPTGAVAKLADVSHRVLMDPETGIDPRARRVVADAHLRMELGNKFMDGLEKEIDAGTTTPADAADQIQQQLGGAGMQSLGRRVNATLGFSTKQTRSNIINNLQRWLPFLSSESGMIPDEIRKVLTLNLNPRAIAKNLGRGEYGSAALQVATQLATGAIGTMLARQALNYAFSGHAMDQNDEGRKLDVQIAKGWYLGNLDPTFDRAARLLGLRDRANHKEPHPGREAVNETLAMMNPAIRMATSAATDATPYIQDDRHLMAARAGWWWPSGFMRNTVQSISEGKGAGRGVAQDLTSFLTGLRLTPSSGKNYTDAERMAHEMAGRHAEELSPEERAKHDARHELISQLREKPDSRGTLVQSAIKAGTIGRSEVSEVIRDSQRDDFQNTVRRLELPDAVKVWEKASTAERVKLRTIMYQKVRDSRDVEQRKRALAVLRAEDSK